MRKSRKQRKEIYKHVDPTLMKIHDMMYSDDFDMAKLGLSMLKGAVYTYGQYKLLRGLTIAGKPFFPYKLSGNVSIWKLELLKNKLPKKYLREQTLKNQENNKNHSYAEK